MATVFGNGDISIYACNLTEKRYELQDRSSGTVLIVFDMFDALVAEALRPYVQDDNKEYEDEEDEDEV